MVYIYKYMMINEFAFQCEYRIYVGKEIEYTFHP